MNTTQSHNFPTADEMVRTLCGSASVEYASVCRLKLWPPDLLRISEDQKPAAEEPSDHAPGPAIRSLIWLVTAGILGIILIGYAIVGGSISRGFGWLLGDDEGQVVLMILIALALLANFFVPRLTGIWPRADLVAVCNGSIILLPKVEHDRKKGVFRCGVPRIYPLASVKLDKLYFAPLSGAFKFVAGDESAEVCAVRRPARYAADYQSTPLISVKAFKAKLVEIGAGDRSETRQG